MRRSGGRTSGVNVVQKTSKFIKCYECQERIAIVILGHSPYSVASECKAPRLSGFGALDVQAKETSQELEFLFGRSPADLPTTGQGRM